MKLNKKGFMMAEVVVVAAVILSFLAGIFISYNKIYSAYKTRLNYYDITALYRLNFYKEYYQERKANCRLEGLGMIGVLECKKKKAEDGRVELWNKLINSNPDYENVNEQVFLIYNNYNNLPASILNSAKDIDGNSVTINQTYNNYVKYLSTSINLTNTKYVMIIERCQKNNQDDCKYAYLEVNDEA